MSSDSPGEGERATVPGVCAADGDEPSLARASDGTATLVWKRGVDGGGAAIVVAGLDADGRPSRGRELRRSNEFLGAPRLLRVAHEFHLFWLESVGGVTHVRTGVVRDGALLDPQTLSAEGGALFFDTCVDHAGVDPGRCRLPLPSLRGNAEVRSQKGSPLGRRVISMHDMNQDLDRRDFIKKGARATAAAAVGAAGITAGAAACGAVPEAKRITFTEALYCFSAAEL